MTTTVIRKKLHQLIDEMDDKKAAAIYMLFKEGADTDLQRKNLVMAEREKYLKGEGKSYSWTVVKKMAENKEKRHAV